MAKQYARMTTLTQHKTGKTVWTTVEEVVQDIDEQQYENMVCDDTLKFFRRLGGSETAQRCYTSKGYKVFKLISTRPDKQERKVRTFEFDL